MGVVQYQQDMETHPTWQRSPSTRGKSVRCGRWSRRRRKLRGMGFSQSRSGRGGYVFCRIKDAWWLVDQIEELRQYGLAQSSGSLRASSNEGYYLQDDEVHPREVHQGIWRRWELTRVKQRVATYFWKRYQLTSRAGMLCSTLATWWVAYGPASRHERAEWT